MAGGPAAPVSSHSYLCTPPDLTHEKAEVGTAPLPVQMFADRLLHCVLHPSTAFPRANMPPTPALPELPLPGEETCSCSVPPLPLFHEPQEPGPSHCSLSDPARSEKWLTLLMVH